MRGLARPRSAAAAPILLACSPCRKKLENMEWTKQMKLTMFPSSNRLYKSIPFVGLERASPCIQLRFSNVRIIFSRPRRRTTQNSLSSRGAWPQPRVLEEQDKKVLYQNIKCLTFSLPISWSELKHPVSPSPHHPVVAECHAFLLQPYSSSRPFRHKFVHRLTPSWQQKEGRDNCSPKTLLRFSSSSAMFL